MADEAIGRRGLLAAIGAAGLAASVPAAAAVQRLPLTEGRALVPPRTEG
ncbi:hypothetical protein [Variovorax sp. RO1]|nr:hypothetical protein [Variovorax sp. RO1]